MMKKILIVDDSQKIRELVEVTLRGGDYKIFQAKSGEEAVETAKKECPDLIIMDVMMPGSIDGLEATRQIKADDAARDLIIIILSAKGQDIDRAAGKEARDDDYFSKPFSPLDLIKKVEEVLE